MDIKLKEEVSQPDLVLDIEEDDGEFFLVAINKDGTKYDLVKINPADETYAIYPKEFKSVRLEEDETL